MLKLSFGSPDGPWLSSSLDLPHLFGEPLPTLFLVTGPEDGAGLFFRPGEENTLRLLRPLGLRSTVPFDPVLEYGILSARSPEGERELGRMVSRVLVSDGT